MNKTEKEYRELLSSGLFFEFYPQLTGDYERDKEEWSEIYEEVVKFRNSL